MFDFEVDLKLLMNGGWYMENLEYDLFLVLWIKDEFDLEFKYLNSADEYIVSEDRNSVSRYILSYVGLYEFILEKDSQNSYFWRKQL